MNKSQLGNVSKRSGDSYSPFEVEAMMERLWAEYSKPIDEIGERGMVKSQMLP
jgi:hypothetical protein